MRMENMPPLFFQAKRWWLWPLLTLPDSVQAKVALWKLKRIIDPPLRQTSSELWQGKGCLLCYTKDPDAFLLRPSLELLVQQFPGIDVLVHEAQADWWQSLLPKAHVVALPELDLWESSHQDWLASQLPKLCGDWCWNLREDGHPLSRALTQILGASWRIGQGGKPWSNLSIEPAQAFRPWQGARVETLRRTFGWESPPPRPSTLGTETALHVPALAPKQPHPWAELARELSKRHKALVFQSGAVGGLEGTQSQALPSAQTLLQLAPRLSLWVGPWDAHAGALAACGVPVLAIGPKSPITPVRHTSRPPKPGMFQAWWEACKKAPPQRDEA